jgi:hypothetical protein
MEAFAPLVECCEAFYDARYRRLVGQLFAVTSLGTTARSGPATVQWPLSTLSTR